MSSSVEELVEGIAKYIICSGFYSNVFDFIDQYKSEFTLECKSSEEEKLRANQFEHKLRYTELHDLFCEKFEKELEQYVEKNGYSISSLQEYLNSGCEESKFQQHQAFILVETLLTIFDYKTFVEVMRDKEKCAYLKQIAQAWKNHYNTI